MPEPLHGDTLDASLTVTNLERSAAWYTTILGFTVDRRLTCPRSSASPLAGRNQDGGA